MRPSRTEIGDCRLRLPLPHLPRLHRFAEGGELTPTFVEPFAARWAAGSSRWPRGTAPVEYVLRPYPWRRSTFFFALSRVQAARQAGRTTTIVLSWCRTKANARAEWRQAPFACRSPDRTGEGRCPHFVKLGSIGSLPVSQEPRIVEEFAIEPGGGWSQRADGGDGRRQNPLL